MNLKRGAVNVGLVVGVVALVVAVVGVVRPAVVERVVEKVSLGAVPTLDGVDHPFVTINGVSMYYANKQITASSTVQCAIQNPFVAATSTIISFTADISDNNMGAAQVGFLSTSTTNAATGTPSLLAGVEISNDGPQDIAWAPGNASSTADSLNGVLTESTTGNGMYLLAPGEWLNFSVSSTTPGTFAANAGIVGDCRAILQKL